MATASIAEIKDLMKSTGVGMMDCKKALEEADGDREKAVTILREKGLATQAKKSGRVAAEGIVTAVVEGNVGAVVEVNIETDFAANNDEFKAFVAAVFGGIGSVPGAMIGGILIGVIEILGRAYISPQLSDAIVFAVLILVLIVKPTGILGKKIREKV